MRPSCMRLSAWSRESQQALAALATLSVSFLAVHAAVLQAAQPHSVCLKVARSCQLQTLHSP